MNGVFKHNMNNNFFDIKKEVQESIKKIVDVQYKTANEFSQHVKNNINIFTEALSSAFTFNTELRDFINSIPDPKKENIDFLIKSGWTIPHALFTDLTTEENITDLSQEEIDNVFVSMYLEDDKEWYYESKQIIISEISPQFKKMTETCFELYENDNIQVTIPALISIVEGEMSHVSGLKDSWGFKNKIIKRFGYGSNETHKIKEVKNISVYSLVFYLSEVLFKTIDFTDEDYTQLNRNKVLHGWDNPENWNQVDFIRLIHTIITILMIKE